MELLEVPRVSLETKYETLNLTVLHTVNGDKLVNYREGIEFTKEMHL